MSGSATGWLHPLDWALVGCYALGLVILGIVVSRGRAIVPLDYFLASRGNRRSIIGLSLFATNISSTALVGLTGGAYASGISVFDYEWSASVILVFFCSFMLPSIIKSRVYTMPEYLERRYDRRTRLIFSMLTLFLNVVLDSASVLYCGSLVCQLLFPTTPLWLIVAALAGAAGIFTIGGGLRSVIYTEAVQAIVLLASALLISLIALHRTGGWHALAAQLDPAALSLIRPASDPVLPWPGLLLGVPLLGFYYWCANQSTVQRLLSAQDLEQARGGALLAGFLKLTVLFLVVMPGMCALVLFPNLPRADEVYPMLISHLLPVGAAGLVVAAFVAATIVSIASLLNSASTLVTMDVIRHIKPQLAGRRLVMSGRLTTATLLVVAIAWAPQLARFPSLWQYLQAVLAYVVPPIVAVFVVGMLWRGATARGAAASLAVGSACGVALFIVNGVLHFTHLHFLYAAPILTGIDMVILVLVSLSDRTALTDESAYTSWRFAPQPDRSASFWRDYRLQAVALLCVTGLLVVAFR